MLHRYFAVFFLPLCISFYTRVLKKTQLKSAGLVHRSVASASRTAVDVAVIGAGPAGSTIAWLLQEQQGCNVAIIDPAVEKDGIWYPNYGEWAEEWQFLSHHLKFPELLDCTTNQWQTTEAFFGGSYGVPSTVRTLLPRPYVRVDRVKLQKLTRERFVRCGGKVLPTKLTAETIAMNVFDQNIQHSGNASVLSLEDGMKLHCKVLIDATGFESKLVMPESAQLARGSEHSIPVGYQIAYGMIATVNSIGPYNPEAMTLFDYRTDHLDDSPQWQRDAEDRPTFLYVMPLSSNTDGTHTVFWEETSLVGKDRRRLSFAECKKRLYKRLGFHGIEVLDVKEEEYCYIPMGGELPNLHQRVIGFGGAANMVHPATGYQACRMMAAAPPLAEAIGKGIRAGDPPDQIARAAYNSMWSQRNREQRDFQVFGGDFFMDQPVSILRGFFSSFFSLPPEAWGGFLAGWPGLPHNELHDTRLARLNFALSMYGRMPTDVKLAIMGHAIKYTAKYGPQTLMRSLLPGVFRDVRSSDADVQRVGDAQRRLVKLAEQNGAVEAKEEARRLMKEFATSKAQSLDSFPSPYN